MAFFVTFEACPKSNWKQLLFEEMFTASKRLPACPCAHPLQKSCLSTLFLKKLWNDMQVCTFFAVSGRSLVHFEQPICTLSLIGSNMDVLVGWKCCHKRHLKTSNARAASTHLQICFPCYFWGLTFWKSVYVHNASVIRLTKENI